MSVFLLFIFSLENHTILLMATYELLKVDSK